MSDITAEDLELFHFGVKGMKWGVRRPIGSDGLITRRQARKQGAAKAKDFTESMQKKWESESTSISKKEYASLSKKDVKLGDANTTFKRVNKGKQKNLRDNTYVTKSEEDHDRYKSFIGGKGNNKHSVSISVSEAIVSPSERARVDTLIKTMGSEVPFGGSVYKGREFFENDASDKALSNHDLGLKYYKAFVQGQTNPTPVHTKYFNTLKDKGYNAIVDDADRGLFSETPIILFKQGSGAKVESSRKLTKDEIAEAQLRMKRVGE